jgi:CHC2 zinc finger
MTKQEAKDRLRIPELWARFNLDGSPGKLCSSPFREDKNPSFSVNENGTLWHDFATDEDGDQIDFFARAAGVSPLFKVQKFIELAVSIFGETELPKKSKPAAPDELPTESKELKARLASCQAPNADQCCRIAALRRLSPIAPFTAAQIGTLVVGQVGGFDCWILTDEKRRLAEARRLDGHKFPAIGPLGERKAHTLKGSKKDWPVGLCPRLANHQKINTIVFVEGGPDYLAAMQLIAISGGDALPVAMLGASAKLCDEARILIGKRRVIIPVHSDQAGKSAADTWGAWLERTGAEVIMRPFKSRQYGEDLNDIVTHFLGDEGALVQLATALLR